LHLEKFYRDIVQFIIAHYCLTDREDTEFWRAVKHGTSIPPDLEARFEIFRKYLPTSVTKGTSEVWMFKDISWFAVLLGMNFEFATPELHQSALTAAKLIRERKRESVRELSVKLPNHYRFLRETVYGRE
jgi:tryptophan halogenase